MPVENSWLIENRVLLTRMIGSITVEDMTISAERGTAMIAAGIDPVYSLVDMTELTGFPVKLSELSAVFKQPSDEKLGWIIIYGIPNRFVNFLATTFAQLSGKHYKVVDTQAEALRLVDHLEGQPLTRTA